MVRRVCAACARSATLGPIVGRLLAAWSETVGVNIVEQALRFAPTEEPESRFGGS